MQHKISIGIPIESHMITQINRKIAAWSDLPIKWYKEENMHVELINIGWVEEFDVQKIKERVSVVSELIDSFSVNFTGITAVSKKIDRTNIADAQIVQIEGEDSVQLRDLHEKICTALAIPYTHKKTFRPYIRLGRMRAKQWSGLGEYPAFPVPISMQMDITSISILENMQVDGGWRIEPIAVYDLR